jgi:endoglucanase
MRLRRNADSDISTGHDAEGYSGETAMRSKTAMAIVFGLCACGGSSVGGPNISVPAPQPASFTPGPAARPTTGVALPLGKCVNLANMLEAPTEGAWGRAFQDSDATRIRQAGFATVRLPVRFSAHALAASPYTIDAAFLARVHHVLDINLATGLNVILDMHHYEELFTDPTGHSARFAELWRQVAADFSGAPSNVWFELINEPNGRLNDSNLMAVVTPALAAVRATNPTRPVVIGGQNWSGIDALATVAFPNDPNIVSTFHYYDPFAFTHQGAPWVTPVMPTGRLFGTAADNAQLNAALQKVMNFMSRTGRVPFLGEYGAYEQIPMDQRVSYYRAISSAFASVGIQSCAWGYTNSFNLWRDATGWEQQLLAAIATTTTVQ